MLGQRDHARHQFVHDALMLKCFVARVQCRQLDGDAGVGVRISGRGAAHDGGDRLRIGEKITARVGVCACRFAEHVVGIEVVRCARSRLLHGFAYVAAEHELARQDLERLADCAARQRFTEALQQIAHQRAEVVVSGRIGTQRAPGQEQRPGRCVDECGAGPADMARPIASANLVGNQCIQGRGVGRAQKRLGETHQGHTLVIADAVFGEKAFQQTALACGAQFARNTRCARADVRACRSVELQIGEQGLYVRFFLDRDGVAYCSAGALEVVVHRCATRRAGRYRMRLPSAEAINSTASTAVWFCQSKVGLTSTISRLVRRSVSAIISRARCASR